ncbi:hypothetical protein P154DRAFT_518771 [Amniculicola lignicola CBS 123094]|uniref:Secreted protein n=1 Tax=Amniculicola lignicola CBS 123094 TaxID=1392246 RepID=A0A6A5WTU9_9PLEO|nr:hypothetical protein P154DRAFT_518771 [Amniculicola lignicola CBS 123094]
MWIPNTMCLALMGQAWGSESERGEAGSGRQSARCRNRSGPCSLSLNVGWANEGSLFTGIKLAAHANKCCSWAPWRGKQVKLNAVCGRSGVHTLQISNSKCC